VFADQGWLSIFLANHDQARMVSRFGNDSPQFRAVSSKMLSTFILTMRGTPYYYNGDELGMTSPAFTNINDYRDLATLNEYKHAVATGGDIPKLMKEIEFSCRDNGRTPFQWDDTKNAGFTTGTPWIKVNPNYTAINAAAEEKGPNSCLNYFRKLTKLRRENLVLVYGKYTLLDKNNPDVYAYTRELNGKKMLVLLNFTSKTARVNTSFNHAGAKLLLDSYGDAPANAAVKTELRAYEAVVYEVK
jgi:oligo-1,6-glucosidase